MPERIREPGHTQQHDWRRLWRDRELFYFLGWRDILVRHKQTVIRPFLNLGCALKAVVMQGESRAGFLRSTWADSVARS
jgi:hypothetical protein